MAFLEFIECLWEMMRETGIDAPKLGAVKSLSGRLFDGRRDKMWQKGIVDELLGGVECLDGLKTGGEKMGQTGIEENLLRAN